jgi:hypothetical protein
VEVSCLPTAPPALVHSLSRLQLASRFQDDSAVSVSPTLAISTPDTETSILGQRGTSGMCRTTLQTGMTKSPKEIYHSFGIFDNHITMLCGEF